MQAVSVKEVVDITKGELIRGDPYEYIQNFSIDSRTLIPGDVFIAIKGNHFDGHQFVKDVIRKGAKGIIIEDGFNLPDYLPSIVVKVKDTIRAMGDIARLFRNRFKGPVIAITGTVGKTTTKEIVSCVLGKRLSVHKTQGTLNNHIGVPITLWGLEVGHSVCIMELGMSNIGEIKYLADIVRPDVGVITNVGPAHLEKLGCIENVVKAKAELLEVMPPEGLIILNRDDPYFSQLEARTTCRLVTVGRHHESDFQAVDIKMVDGANLEFKVIAKPFSDILDVRTPIIGLHNIYPSLIAIAIGYGFRMAPEDILSGLIDVKLPKMRLELKEIAGIKVLDDSYNANPISMQGALETLCTFSPTGKRIFVCGDMLELGKDALKYHKELGRQIVKYKVDRLVTIGRLSKIVSSSAIDCGMQAEYVRHCNDNVEAVSVLAHWLEPGDIVLVKGSRLMHMEEITKGMEEYYSTLEKLIV